MNRLLGGILLLAFGVLLTAEAIGKLGLAGMFGWLGLINAKLGMVAGPVAILFGIVQIVRSLTRKPARGKR